MELDERGTVLDCAVSMTGLARPQAQQLLGRFLFSGYAEHEKQVSVLSGGERRRLSLAVIVASGANLLVLDEPTNHLDLESREALEAALEAFPGAILLVSHDRALLDAVAERTVAIENHTLRSYDGGWADLVRAREEVVAPPAAPERKAKEPKPAKPAARKGPTELEQTERRITTLEQHVVATRAEARRRLDEHRPADRVPNLPRRAPGAARPLGSAVRICVGATRTRRPQEDRTFSVGRERWTRERPAPLPYVRSTSAPQRSSIRRAFQRMTEIAQVTTKRPTTT